MSSRWFLDGGDLPQFQDYVEANLDLAIRTQRFAASMFKIFDTYKYLKIDRMKAYDIVFNAFGVKGVQENFTPCSLAYFEPKPGFPIIHNFYHQSKITMPEGAMVSDRGSHMLCHFRKTGIDSMIVTFDPNAGFAEISDTEWNAWLQSALGQAYGFAADHMVISLKKA